MKLTAFHNTGVGRAHMGHRVGLVQVPHSFQPDDSTHGTYTVHFPLFQARPTGIGAPLTYMPNFSSIYSAHSYSSNAPAIAAQHPLPRPAK